MQMTEAAHRDTLEVSRVAIRQRPRGWPLMYQTWDKLLFLHWPIASEWLRPLIPPPLEIDKFEDTAWIGVTPFTIPGIRPPLVPALPRISSSHELNVRTYVHLHGVPGVWFISLDASNPLAVWGARIGFALPYYRAGITMDDAAGRIRFRSRRTHRRASPAEFEATWRRGERFPPAVPGSRDFFLIERYCLYSARGGRLYRARIHHRPWPLCAATIDELCSSMIEAPGLPTPEGPPLVHAQAEPLRVGVWRPERVGPTAH